MWCVWSAAEQSRQRRELVSRKTEEYLRHAEALHQTHLSSSVSTYYLSVFSGMYPAFLQEGTGQDSTPNPTSIPVPAMQPHLLKDFKVLGLLGKVYRSILFSIVTTSLL